MNFNLLNSLMNYTLITPQILLISTTFLAHITIFDTTVFNITLQERKLENLFEIFNNFFFKYIISNP